ncbi:RdgB/HAM1 family non-canonical purine NTP pyrophosphatase [Treponema phagedenis]|uniref:RdgB/HAM1 family non-canonical purine NTP pyrophosphatase n=1 Tax=Treponema phagedenis TaxID=162 RepID=UPI0001F63CD5|nr:RdgB/HAM1 family non-canonical purine NTP pyrophosphatase [Treponema phagedenis]EFW37667.1 non-canonical purine NTP pyrophosphatase, RdgB/HAM1 family [Treponema phagedenis F0421]NVP24453.1 RdgB/HAM1 family non-canonical purine NTP pyrophosphatase [Treponema phagedenis]QEK06343.1 RdgB/HAM1 family non-canonical purine NTP pyrophosphatase [Treponema phagedenis]QKS92701.1 RdgB/HAM1 family non-canonical purine NTP pyrophosphatase [Treponema phagedenis]QLC58665.1 RdgB/HAM1 family non-canonical pu
MKLYIATGNEHKKKEFMQILQGIHCVLPKDEGISFDPEETGSSFLENALIKAKALFSEVKQPVIADDSGICIDALGGMPGVYSARYGDKAGKILNAEEKNMLVLQQMTGKQERSCRFVCCIVLMLSADRIYTVQETCEGIVADKPFGEGGFGYDPIVYLPTFQKTVAELSEEEKNRFSHRGKAGAKIAALLKML